MRDHDPGRACALPLRGLLAAREDVLMAVVLDHPVDDEHAATIEGRPDFADRRLGVTLAKRFPPYVFSIRGVSCLVHRITRVELHWYRVARGGHALRKLKRPVMIAHTCCSMFLRLDPRRSRTCRVPAPDSLLHGRCHGDVATFGRSGAATKAGVRRQEAHVKLGCVVEGY